MYRCEKLGAAQQRSSGALLAERRGSVALLAAASLSAIIGMAALALDIGAAYTQKATLQKVADSAAMAGAISWLKSSSSAATMATISDVVVANGWPASIIQNPTQFYLAHSPKSAASPAIQVKLAAASSFLLAEVVGGGTSATTAVTSVVQLTAVPVVACVLSLTTITVNSNAAINATGCDVVANSSSSQAILLNSNATINASVATPGNVRLNSGSSITGSKTTGAAAATNPYSADASAASAGFTGCHNYNNTSTLTPGCWNNVNVNSGTSLSLSPGTYFFTNINVNSGGSLTGTGGVTIVTQNNFSPSGNVTLTAPTSGAWDGIALYAMGGLNINSGVTYNVNGAIYSPTTALNLNNASFNANACTFLVAYSLTLNSGATLTLPQTNCASYGFTTPTVSGGKTTIALVQ
jgi:hypothetical protein